MALSGMTFSRLRIIILACAAPLFAQSPATGIKNFYQVDEHVYRGAQPDQAGFDFLAKLGVKTVINLREPGPRSRMEERLVTAEGMKYIGVPMTGLTPPSDAEISKILGILENDISGPVFVHCKRGADRTGAVIAAYRIAHDGWDNTRALTEAMNRGMSKFQLPRQGYIRNFQRKGTEASATVPKLLVPAAAVLVPLTAQ
jgi:tyrosine-protein phosphatase SIW14